MKTILSATLGLFVFAMAGFNARAVQMRPLSVDELTRKADLILEGVVTSKTSLQDTNGGIYTKTEIAVSEVWKGNLSSNTFTIVQGGGTVGDTRVEVSGQVQYEVGEEVVAFLVLSPRGGGVTIGLSQGKFHVAKDPVTGEKLVHNPFHGLPEPAQRGKASAQANASAARQRLTISDLKNRVNAASR